MHNLIKILSILLYLVFFPCTVAAAESSSVGQAPDGFDDFLAPQKTVIDVFYQNRFIVAASATYSLTGVSFSNPDVLIQAIPSIKRPPTVLRVLEGELDKNAHLICRGAVRLNCGILEPTIAGVIFDENRFRVDLFIHPDYLSVQPLIFDQFLPDSNAGLAVIQNLRGTISGNLNDNNRQTNYTLFGDTLFSYEENSLQLGWDQSRNQNFSINEMLFERDYQGKLWQAGLVYSSGIGLSFSSSPRLWGARLASSYNSRTSTSITQGTPLDIFIPVRGRYEILREERLIDSGFIEAGSRQLNTSSFPSGAYDLVIRLLDEQGNLIREETRFFAKQNRLPPRGEPEYFMEAGRVALSGEDKVLPELTDNVLARAGINMRLSDTISSTLATALTKGQGLAEASLFHIGQNYDVSTALMYAGNSDYGVKGEGRLTVGDLSLGANISHLWRGESVRNGYDLLGNAFRQTNLSASYPLFSGSLSYRFSDNRNRDINNNSTGREIRQSLAYSRSIYQDNLYSASIRLDGTRISNGAFTGLVSVDFRRSQENWTYQVSPQSSLEKDESGKSQTDNSILVTASYDDNDELAGNLRGTLRAEKASARTSVGASGSFQSTWGKGNLNLNYVENNGNSSTSYSAGVNTSFIANRKTIALGGGSQSPAAVVVNVAGAAHDDRFAVYVDNQRRSFTEGDSSSIVHLSPFQTYKVRIKSEGDSVYSQDEKEYQVTLYPGNAVALDYKVQRVVIVYGRVLLPDGQWLTNANIRGGVGLAASDELGVFQAEISSDTKHLVFSRRGEECKVPLSVSSYKDDFVSLGQVVCQP